LTAPIALVVAHREDGGAAAVAADLERRLGPGSARLLRPESLGLARWSHRIDARGHAETCVAFGRDCIIDSRVLRVVFNRIRRLPAVNFRRATPRNRDYAGAELQALIVSWLAELDARAVPPVRAHPWVVTPLPATRWVAAAAACKLPVVARTLATSPRLEVPTPAEPTWGSVKRAESPASAPRTSVVVAGDDAAGKLSGGFGAACISASHQLGLPLLEFRFVRAGREWLLEHVDAMPALDEAWSAALAAGFLESIARRGHS
jgi:hypothetical protein